MTEVSRPALSIASGASDPQIGTKHRGPAQAVQFLVPLWGTPFIGQFLQTSLPTLLAPGNLPAVAKALPSKFVFLTNTDGADILSDHPAIHYLREICQVEFSIIDDLITGDNYSTTITLAYARAVRATGTKMADTCFFFLISDYIMADGSLANVLARVQAGYSGVVAGNFQVTEEHASESFFDTFDAGEPAIVFNARELMRWAIKFLHPMTLANMVNFPLCHSEHSNRLFWHVGENTLVGRFYLMHMICIRPEVTNFDVGSSCDYSFIPEMCPSGNVHVMTDSDEYMVVEMQKVHHEEKFVRLGAVDQSALKASLAEWTTAIHRQNAHSAVIFHSADLPSNLDSAITETAAYINEIERSLPPPQRHRNHPYWLGAISAHRWAVARMKGEPRPPRNSTVPRFHDWVYGLRAVIFGRQPYVRRWHPRWPDFKMIRTITQRHCNSGRLLFISHEPDTFSGWLKSSSRSVNSINLEAFLEFTKDEYRPLMGVFDCCLLILRESDMTRCGRLIDMIRPMLRPDEHLLVCKFNGEEFSVNGRLRDDLLREISAFFDPAWTIDDVHFVPGGRSVWMASRVMRKTLMLALKNAIWAPLAAIAAGLLMAVCFVCNLRRHTVSQPAHNQLFSSVAVAMRGMAESSSKIDDIIKESPITLAGRRFTEDRVRLATAAPAANA